MILRGSLSCLAAAICLAPTLAHGQMQESGTPVRPSESPKPSVLTILTVPGNADVTLRGNSDLAGRTPIDVPPLMTGLHTVVVQGPGFSRTQGVIFLPPRGGLPFVVSESPGVSAGLILRGFNFPGVPDWTSGRFGRGFTLAASAFGAGFMAVRSHASYRQRLDEVGQFSEDRAQDEKGYRNAWLIYGAAVWGTSALDYWIRPRLSLSETTPTRLTLRVPKAGRGSAIWRSLLVPGAGQESGNHRTRSIVWLSTVLLSGAGCVVADYRVLRDETELKWAKIQLANAGPSEQAQRQLESEQATRSVEASKDVLRGFVIATASLHALNLIDAMIMPLNMAAPDKPKVSSIVPIMLPDGPGVAVSLRF
jgi:hypothetical protein